MKKTPKTPTTLARYINGFNAGSGYDVLVARSRSTKGRFRVTVTYVRERVQSSYFYDDAETANRVAWECAQLGRPNQ